MHERICNSNADLDELAEDEEVDKFFDLREQAHIRKNGTRKIQKR